MVATSLASRACWVHHPGLWDAFRLVGVLSAFMGRMLERYAKAHSHCHACEKLPRRRDGYACPRCKTKRHPLAMSGKWEVKEALRSFQGQAFVALRNPGLP